MPAHTYECARRAWSSGNICALSQQGAACLGPCKEAARLGCSLRCALLHHMLARTTTFLIYSSRRSQRSQASRITGSSPGLVMMLQEQSREHYVLAAAVQEIPAGHAMFFHRMSASAKFNLESPSYLHTTHMTARPLKSVEYAPIMVTDPLFDNRRTQWSARWPAEAFDATVAQRCAPHSTAMACMQHLHISRPAQWAKIQQEGTSVPVLPVSFWVNIEHAINFSYAMFEHIRSHQNVSSQPTVPPRHHLRFSARWNIGL